MGSGYELILYILYIDVQSLPRSPATGNRREMISRPDAGGAEAERKQFTSSHFPCVCASVRDPFRSGNLRSPASCWTSIPGACDEPPVSSLPIEHVIHARP
jgi:hypothetical protein